MARIYVTQWTRAEIERTKTHALDTDLIRTNIPNFAGMSDEDIVELIKDNEGNLPYSGDDLEDWIYECAAEVVYEEDPADSGTSGVDVYMDADSLKRKHALQHGQETGASGFEPRDLNQWLESLPTYQFED